MLCLNTQPSKGGIQRLLTSLGDGKACVRSIISALAAGRFRIPLRLLHVLKPMEVSGVVNICPLGVEEVKWFASS